MKKLLAVLLALCLIFSLSAAAMAAEETDDLFDVGLTVTPSGDTITVTVTNTDDNNAVLADLKPSLSIPCGFSQAYVTYNDAVIESTLSGGKITFTVSSGAYPYVIHSGAAPEEEEPTEEEEKLFRVTVNKCLYGMVSAIPAKAAKGDTVTLIAAPNGGYKLDTITATYEKSRKTKTLTLTDKGSNIYTFKMPAADVTISATFVKTGVSAVFLTIGQQNIVVDTATVTLDVAPIIYHSRTMVPLRFLAEAFGAEVSWDAATRTVFVTYEGQLFTVTIDQPIPGFDTPAIIRNSRTLVPVRYFAEKFGCVVDWNAATRQVMIIR